MFRPSQDAAFVALVVLVVGIVIGAENIMLQREQARLRQQFESHEVWATEVLEAAQDDLEFRHKQLKPGN
jgi:uncharacterized membrane-anchored protein YhcB (DUF1043 family)